MKKVWFFVLALVPLLLSCQRQEADRHSRQVLSFSISSPEVKSTYIPSSSLGSLPVYVSATYKKEGVATPFLTNRTFSRGGDGKYHASPLVYWPLDGSLDFLAYAGTDDVLSGSGNPSITWEANPSDGASITFTNTKAADIDLLWATANRKDKSSGEVELDFHHALARLELQVQVQAGSLNDGRLRLKSVALETSLGDRLALGGVFTIDNTRNFPTGTWSGLTTLSDYAFFTGQDITFSSTGSTSLVGLLDGTARVARDGVAVPLVNMYVPRQANKNLVVTYSRNGKPDTVQSVNLVRGDWEMGKQYTYCLEFAPPLVQITVRTVGQQKDDYYQDASSTGISTFNHSWGE